MTWSVLEIKGHNEGKMLWILDIDYVESVGLTKSKSF